MSFKDYSSELRISKYKPLRILYFVLGWVTLLFATVGIFLPGWPTTIWAILSMYFFMRSSKKFYNYIMNHPQMGPLIRNWREGKGMTRNTKVVAVTLSNVTILFSVYVIPHLWIDFFLVIVASSLTTYLLTLPTYRKE